MSAEDIKTTAILDGVPEDWKMYVGYMKTVFDQCGIKWARSKSDPGCVWAEPRVETLHSMWAGSEYPRHMNFEDFLIKTMGGDGTGDA